MKRRTAAFVLSFVLLITLLPIRPVFAVQNFTIRGTDAATVAGTNVSVDLLLENNPGFSAMNLYYRYNEDYFTLTEVENKATWFTMTHVTTTVWDAASNYTEDGTLGTLYFTVADNTPVGEYEIEIMFLSAANDAFEELTAKTVSARVIVEEKECPHTSKTEIPFRSATCTDPGNYLYYICNTCGATLKADGVTETTAAAEVIPPQGHDWHGTGCSRCNTERRNPFTDVPENSFYIDPVLWAVENGITNGTSATTFGPNDECMRAHVVTFLWRAMGSPEPESAHNPFVDVKTSDFYFKAVLWAVENGITNGLDATHFGPFAYCNRAQVVTFLYRTMQSPEINAASNHFVDVVTGSFYEKPVLWAVENGITNGLSATHFGPNAICNRAQIVTFLYRAFVND